MTPAQLLEISNLLQHVATKLRAIGMVDAALDIDDIGFEVWEKHSDQLKAAGVLQPPVESLS